MKITKDTLKQLVMEELKATLDEQTRGVARMRARLPGEAGPRPPSPVELTGKDRVAGREVALAGLGRDSPVRNTPDMEAIVRAEDAAMADIDAEYGYAPEVAAKMKSIYEDGVSFVIYPSEPGDENYEYEQRMHKKRSQTGTSASRRYYKKGISDALRITAARQTPSEYVPDDEMEDTAAGPYQSSYEAQSRARAQDAAKKQALGAQARNPMGAYQALGDAAMRGSGKAMNRLAQAAKTDPDAQAMLDAVLDAKREAKRETPLSADLEADMLEEIIREEIEAALSERVDPVKLAKDRADKQCAKHGKGSAQCKKFRKRHKDAERSARKK